MQRLIGQFVGRYRIDELLGEGGMGAVFKAYDARLHREVAIKVVHPHIAREPQIRDRFIREARATAKLSHRGIVRVFDFGEIDSRLYIVMEFIPGGHLKRQIEHLQRKGLQLRISEAIQVVRELCLALDYAHRQGIVHRDIKPENILLKAEATETLSYQPVITDLGIAKLLNAKTLTEKDELVGTAAYMSPEQALALQIDARSDIYSLGVVLYELAVGQRPFPIKNVYQIYYHVKEAPPAPRSIRADVPQQLEQIILKALAKQPNDRFANAAMMADALLNLSRSNHPPQLQRPPTIEECELIEIIDQDYGMISYKARSRRDGQIVIVQKYVNPNELSFWQNTFNYIKFRSQIPFHPNIMQMYRYSTDPSNLYSISEFFNAQSLSQVISRQGKININLALHIIYQVCDALDVLIPLMDYKLSHNPVHWKVRPKNIFLANNNKVKIYVNLTTFNECFYIYYDNEYHFKIIGGPKETWDYMSIEETDGGPRTHNVHVYSVGIILYQMITGQLPFTGNAFERMNKRLKVPATPPRQLNPQIPPHIERAILKALEKKPKQRFQTLGEFVRALKDPTANEFAQALKDPTPNELARALKAPTPGEFAQTSKKPKATQTKRGFFSKWFKW